MASTMDLANGYVELINMLDNEEIDLEAFGECILGFNEQASDKLDNIAKLRTEALNAVSGIDAEIERLKERKDKKKRMAERMLELTALFMNTCGFDKYETTLHSFGFRKSKGLIITDESKVPEEFIKVKTTTSVDKKALTDFIKAHPEELEYAYLEERRNPYIK